MKFSEIHPWPQDPRQAIRLQEALRGQVIRKGPGGGFLRVAGADVSYDKPSGRAYAAVLVFALPDLELLEQVEAHDAVHFPYIPGLLSFREAPVLLQAFRKIRREPEVILLDGQGIAHPRGFGLAAHVGLILDRPTIGCAKSRLVGHHEDVENATGASVPLFYRDEVVGAVLRTRRNAKPVYVSPGHRIDIATALDVVMATCRGYRLPEVVRRAHLAVTEARKGSTIR